MNPRWSCVRGLVAVLTLGLSLACSAPTLEDPRCAEAQDKVRRFYSLHFDRQDVGADAGTAIRPFLTDRLAEELAAKPVSENDYFTTGERFPKAFRVGTCRLQGDERAELDVLMLWRTEEERSMQREVRVTVAKNAGSWLIDAVSPL